MGLGKGKGDWAKEGRTKCSEQDGFWFSITGQQGLYCTHVQHTLVSLSVVVLVRVLDEWKGKSICCGDISSFDFMNTGILMLN